jgi:protein TonB
VIALDTVDLAEVRRWALAGAVVALVHGGIAAAMVAWREPVDLSEPAAAIVIHFAPVAVAPLAPETGLPPGPEQVASDAAPSVPGEISEEKIERKLEQRVEARLEPEDRPQTRPVEELPPQVPPAPDPEVAVALAPRPQEVRQERQQQQQDPRTPAPVTTAPQALPVETAPVAAAPEQGQFKPSNSRAVQIWQRQIVALLERNKRYPPGAQSRRQQGVVQVSFSLDRQGRVVESRVVRSSGVAALDEEAVALVRRAQPFPAWPAGQFPGERIGLTVPIGFYPK